MPRSKCGKTRAPINTENLKSAIDDVLQRKFSLQVAADNNSVSKTTLIRHLKFHKLSGNREFKYESHIDVKKILNGNDEALLVDYIKTSARLHYGLTKYQVRVLAYQYCKQNERQIPANWEREKRAGRGWLRYFIQRHRTLSLRKPEATSLARATSFNKNTVSNFFSNLKECYQRYPFRPDQIYNVDETGNSTVHVPPKLLAPKGMKQIGTVTSGERGLNITMISAVNAVGNHVPPMLIFPRVHFKDHMLKGAPIGSIGGANQSGWSNEELFIKYLEHFITYVKPTNENRVLLILDNHQTHITVEAIYLARKCGVVLLTMPPHTSHKLQPLDRTVFGPYKTFYNQAANEWMSAHPGNQISLYDVAEIIGKAYPRAFNIQNIVKGFEVTGIWPLNADIFGEDEYLSAYVTDRPFVDDNPVEIQENRPSTSHITQIISPEIIRPFPKAPPRKEGAAKGRKPGRTRILTDSVEKNEIEEDKLKRDAAKIKKAQRKIVESSDEEENDQIMTFIDSSDDEDFLNTLLEEKENEEKEQELVGPVTVGSYVLVSIRGKKSVRNFVAEIIKTTGEEHEVKYFKKIFGNKFIECDEISVINDFDIIKILPAPSPVGLSKRQSSQFTFAVDFSQYSVC